MALTINGTVAKSTTNSDLTVTTSSDGFITFSNVPVLSSGSYGVRITTIPTGYTLPGSAPTTVSVSAGGSIVQVAPIQLVRSEHTVNIELDTDATDDPLSGVVSARLAPTGSNPTFGGSAFFLTGTRGRYSNSFQQVPFGTYTLTLVLPADHLAIPVVPGAAMSCDPIAPETLVARNCTATVTVPDTGSADVNPTFALHESEITFLSSIGNKLNTDAVEPTEVDLTVTEKPATGGTTLVYRNRHFAVGGSSTTLWVPDNGSAGLEYDFVGDPGSGFAGWSGSATLTAPTHGSVNHWGTANVALDEVGAGVSFTVTHGGVALAPADVVVIDLTPPTGVSGPTQLPTTVGGPLSVSNVPYSSGWSALVSIDGGTTFTTTPVTFDVGPGRTGCTGTSSVTCAVALDVP
jgi:hypothetical protein